jgi:hypothetical protein
VLVFMRYGGRGKLSGLELGEMRSSAAILWDLRDGNVTRLVHYWDRERALAELGLAPEPCSPDSWPLPLRPKQQDRPR